jgi:hypothetical protein
MFLRNGPVELLNHEIINMPNFRMEQTVGILEVLEQYSALSGCYSSQNTCILAQPYGSKQPLNTFTSKSFKHFTRYYDGVQIKDNEIGGAFSVGGMIDVYSILVGNPEGKRPLGRPRRR